MTPSPSPPTRGAPDPRLRGMYWILLALAAIALGLVLWNASRFPARHRPYAWLIPVGLLCMGIGGLVGNRSPLLQRALIGIALVFAVAGVVVAFTS